MLIFNDIYSLQSSNSQPTEKKFYGDFFLSVSDSFQVESGFEISTRFEFVFQLQINRRQQATQPHQQMEILRNMKHLARNNSSKKAATQKMS